MPSPQALSAIHLAGDPQARTWLGEPWTGLQACADRARTHATAGTWDRAALSAFPGAQILADPRSVVVVTGQQPAVGGGPCYTLVKIAHAIALARRLDGAGVPALAWFWCASEDHDLGEANHADLIRRDGTIIRVGADLGLGRAALRHRPARIWWETLTTTCRAELGTGLGAAWLIGHQPHAGETMGAWTCRLIADLFQGAPLVACEGHQLRPLWHAALGLALSAWPREALALRRAELLRHGQPDAFGELTAAPLFHDTPQGRTAVDSATAHRLLDGRPDELSPGAALRPILQQVALPAAAAILGPGELAYHAFLGAAYPALGVAPPLLVPRCSLSLCPGWSVRAADRLGLSLEALADGAPLPHRSVPHSQQLLALEAAIDGLDASDPRTAAAQVRLRREVGRLAASMARGARAAAGLPAPGSLAAYLRPRGLRQERVMSLFQAVWEHGPGLAAELVAAADGTPPDGHRVLRLDQPIRP